MGSRIGLSDDERIPDAKSGKEGLRAEAFGRAPGSGAGADRRRKCVWDVVAET